MAIQTLFLGQAVNTPISATTVSARSALQSNAGQARILVIATETGDADIFVVFGDSSVVATIATGMLVHGGSVRGFRVPENATHVAAITRADTATVNLVEGFGL